AAARSRARRRRVAARCARRSARAAPPTAHPAAPLAAWALAGGGRAWLRIKPFRKNWNRSASSAARSVLVNLNLNRCSSLGALPSPLWGGVGGGGGAMFLRWRHPHLTASPPPQPSPTRGEGAHRVRGGERTDFAAQWCLAVTPAAVRGRGWVGRAGGCAGPRRSSLGARARPRIPAPGGAARDRAWRARRGTTCSDS